MCCGYAKTKQKLLVCISCIPKAEYLKIIIIFIIYKAQYPNMLKALYNKKLFIMC